MSVDYIELAADIVSAFVSNNSVPVTELPALIASVHSTLGRLSNAATEEKVEALTPAVSVKRSVTPDYVICLEDGKKFKSLKRHLRTRYEMTPDQYRAKWNLRATTRWWHRTMLRHDPNSPRIWGWASSAGKRGRSRNP